MAHKPANRLLAEPHAGGGEHCPITVAELWRPVGQQDDVAAPTGHDERRADGLGPAAVHRQREVADLPAVAERAVEHRPAPERLDARQRGGS